MSHDHHAHDHHHGEAEGSRRDVGDDRPLSVARRRFLAGLGATGVATTLGAVPAHAHDDRPPVPVNPWRGRGRWFAGDHHTHTKYSSDGQYEVAQQVAKAREHGLDWIVITDHGGVAHEKFSVGQVAPDVERARRAHRDVLVYQGLEWNIPGAEHATVFLPPGRSAVDILRAFEAAYDGGILSTPAASGGKGLIARATSADGEPYALAALRYLEAQVLSGRTEIALMFANHPARRGVDSPHELR
ncbi:PHP domain-containing protein, partial [Actinosynnema sp. NPDC059335]|uniref:PHP domain-containing protein n=1 Tax=Actinosynnema sp. NPDC059335 TaxID=3346804 RepID=UPI00366DAD42